MKSIKMYSYSLFIAAAVVSMALHFTSCTESPSPNKGHSENRKSIGAKPFENQVFRTLDNREKITLISPDELEITKQGGNLVCSYTRQGDTLRVVAQMFGTTQALYYREISGGLQAQDGTLLYLPKQYKETLESIRLAEQQEQERKRQEAEALRLLEQKSKQATKTVGAHPFLDIRWHFEKGTATITDTGIVFEGHGIHQNKDQGPGAKEEVWFGHISHQNLHTAYRRPNPACKIYRWRAGLTEYDVVFNTEEERNAFSESLHKAVQEWRSKFSSVTKQKYSGVKQVRNIFQ